MQSKNSSKEPIAIIITIAVLTLIFSFNDGNPKFIWNLWLRNLAYVFILVSISFLAFVFSCKLLAYYYESKVEFRLAYISRVWFNKQATMERKEVPKLIRKIPLGVILAIFAALASSGKFFLTSIFSFDSSTSRLGYRWRNVTQLEEAKIAFSGLFALLLLLSVFSLLSLSKGVIIATWLIVWNLLPLPNLPGGKIAFGARTLWVLTVILMGVSILLIPIITPLIVIPLAIILSLIFALFYFRYVEYSG
ncbi:MAG TPA: hypothetical protein VJJ21_00115 [Candidatus Nanoarchaeia archaeon]|nr:hypothetical protein [Candidatus Nanoarchaeia archaeon]